MDPEAIKFVERTIEELHHCKAKFKEKTYLIERYSLGVLWEGEVYIFELQGHPKAPLAYVLGVPIPGTDRTQPYVFLHIGVVDSAVQAVRAAIVTDGESRRKRS